HEQVSSDDAAGAQGAPGRVTVAPRDQRESGAEWGASGPSLLGETVGSIRIVEYIGKGSFGEVYAGYDEKLNRKVALKALRTDLRLEAEARARFLREARMLSQLDHPHICRIYDLIAAKGRDFLILELLTGTSLGKSIKRPFPRPLKFKIAEQVARALAAAHEKGIVHRDLKPENVMITSGDEVKVLDFGLARPYVDPMATTLDLRNAGPDQVKPSVDEAGGEFGTYAGTRAGAVMGTPGYMSPEQARGEPVTPASDIYSFGLMIQELFSGCPAVEKHLTVRDVVERASRGESRPFVDKDRDLATLVSRLKSLAPASRPSALDAAERLQWIAQKPRRRKLRRLAAGIAAVLVATTTVAVIQGLRANRAAVRAEREAETAKQVSEFLTSIFKVSDPSEARGKTITAREILEKGAKKIGTELKGQPLVQARLMNTMGTVFMGLGLYEEAEPLLSSAMALREKNLPPEHLELADSSYSLAILFWNQGKYAEAEPMHERALAIREKALGSNHLDVATSLTGLANLYWRQGKYAEAEPLYKRALAIEEEALGPDHSDVAASLNDLANLYQDQGRYAEAEPLFKRTLAIWQKVLGPDSPEVAVILNNLANLYQGQGKYAEAAPLLKRALEIHERVLGPGHPDVATNLNNLATLYWRQGRYAGAEPLFKRALAIWEKALGPDRPDVGVVLTNLANFYRDQGRYAEAEPRYRRALAIHEKALGANHPDVGWTLNNLAVLYRNQGKYAEALPLFKRALAIRENALGPDHPDVAESLDSLASLYAYQDKFTEAQPLYKRALAIREKAIGPASRKTVSTLRALAACEYKEKKFNDALDHSGHCAAIGRELAVKLSEDPGVRFLIGGALLLTGQIETAMGKGAEGQLSWKEAFSTLQPVAKDAEGLSEQDTYAQTLLCLGRTEEARPIVKRLFDKGYRNPDLLALCRDKGLMPAEASAK
ncbi:MAG: tetratricopeptide repeat protein, partial [Thermoanaerobaculales bacterium]